MLHENQDIVLLKLNQKWQTELPFGWFPIYSDLKIPNTTIYQAHKFEEIIGKLANVLLNKFKLTEIYEIEEGGHVSVQRIQDCNFQYTGPEYIYTDFEYTWVMYFSHENSVTIGGKKLLETIREIWSAHKDHIWTGPSYG